MVWYCYVLHVDSTTEDTLAVIFTLFPILRVTVFPIKVQNPANICNLIAQTGLLFLVILPSLWMYLTNKTGEKKDLAL